MKGQIAFSADVLKNKKADSMEIEFGPFETFSYAIYKEGSAW